MDNRTLGRHGNAKTGAYPQSEGASPHGASFGARPQPYGAQAHPQAPAGSADRKPVTACGILAVVFGGIALLTSFIPIINNGSFLFGLVGLVLGAVALAATRATGRKSGRALAVVGFVLSIVSMAIVLWLQASWAAMLS